MGDIRITTAKERARSDLSRSSRMQSLQPSIYLGRSTDRANHRGHLFGTAGLYFSSLLA